MASWLTGWSKRIKLTIDSSKIDSDLSNFPVPLYLSSSSGITNADVTAIFDELGSDANRKKIAVTTSDGVTQCYVEIERWDHANKKAWLHVKVPSISSSVDTELYLYYDSSQSDNSDYIGDTGDAPAQSVWDDDFAMVLHFEQDPSGGSQSVLDSSGNGNHATPSNLESADLVDGLFGKAYQFDGADEYVSFPTGLVTGANARTIEVLFKNPAQADTEEVIVLIGSLANGETFLISGAPGPSIRYNTWGGGSYDHEYSITVNEWHYAAFGYDGSQKMMWLDSAEKGTATVTINTGSTHAVIGQRGDSGRYFNGLIASVRISKVNRSNAWRKATYNGLFDSMVTYGEEQSSGNGDTPPSTETRQTLTSSIISFRRGISSRLPNIGAHRQ